MTPVEFYFNLNNLLYLLIVLGAASLLFYAEKLEKSDKIKFDRVNTHTSYLFIGLLLILAVHSMAPLAIPEWVATFFMIAAVALGAVKFYLNRDKLTGIEEEKRHEEIEEKKREMEFAWRYPVINQVRGVRIVARWIYKEGWKYAGGLGLILIIYSLIIFYKLGNYGFQVDEFYHALVAKNWFEYHEWFKIAENNTYYRGALVSFLAIISKTIFPSLSDEFAYRLPIASFGIINIFLIYTLSKKILTKDLSFLVSLFFATDIWFIEFARYLRFYTVSITIILFMLIYIINKDFSIKALFVSACFSVVFYFLLTEYFLFIAFFIGALMLNKIRYKNRKRFIFLLFISSLLLVLLLLYRIIQMGFYMDTYNFFDYNLFNFTDTIAHLRWLTINYWYVLIAIIPSIFILLRSLFNSSGNNYIYTKQNFILLFVLFNFLVIFGYIDHVGFNFTFRPFLFILPVGIIVSIVVFYISLLSKKISIYLIISILILSNGYVLSSNHATEYGEKYYPYKLFFEKQPLIIDTKTPYIFFKNYIDTENITNYSTFVVALNEYPFVYYTDTNPTYLVRWKGSTIGGLSTIGTPLIYDPDEFINAIQKENSNGNSVFVITYATIYPIENQLYKSVFDVSYTPEADRRIAQILEKDFVNYKIYIGKDNFSSVYHILPVPETKL